MKFDPNDPKWTAYVLNELNDRELADVEQEISKNPEAKKLVDEIRMMTGELSSAFAREAEIELDDVQKNQIRQSAERSPAGRIIRFPGWAPVAISAAAALIVAVIGFQYRINEQSASESSAYVHQPPADRRGGQSAATSPDIVASVDVVVEIEPSDSVVAPPRGADKDDGVNSLTPPAGNQWAESVGRVTARAKNLDNPLGLQAAVEEVQLADIAAAASPAVALPASQLQSRNAVGYMRVTGFAGGGLKNAMPAELSYIQPQYGPSLDDFAEIRDNVFQRVADHPLSTFSIDVDTASYSVMRKILLEGRLPPKDAVRIEELINYFPYDYEVPRDGKPFASNMEIAPCPWKPEHYLVRVALKGREIEAKDRPACNLVYLLDVSGSMNEANKLPLVKRAMQALVKQLDERDHVSIVVYAGAAGLVLPPTRGDQAQAILDAIERLQAGGSTAGGAGIQLAYQTAREHFQTNAANRVILCTDGDFNVGMTQRGDLERMIEQEAKSGIFLTVLGFGMGNYKDSTLEVLSNKGNGYYAYIDDFSEARKVLVDQFMGTLVTIAKDVKIQVEFNPAHVAGYRLIGYENRMLKKEDFNNDKVDAGEIGAGHTVTAFYEIIPAGQPFPDVPAVDKLKYQVKPVENADKPTGEILTLKLRYKEPEGDVSSKLEFPLEASRLATMDPSSDFRFASAVAGFGMLLRESEHRGEITYEQVLNLAEQSIGEDKLGYRTEFIKLVRNAMAIAGEKN